LPCLCLIFLVLFCFFAASAELFLDLATEQITEEYMSFLDTCCILALDDNWQINQRRMVPLVFPSKPMVLIPRIFAELAAHTRFSEYPEGLAAPKTANWPDDFMTTQLAE
jgi:hypothetical protein